MPLPAMPLRSPPSLQPAYRRPLAGAQVLRRARDAAIERAVIGGCLMLALVSGSFAAYTLAGSTGEYRVQNIVPPMSGGFAWKKGVAPIRTAAVAAIDLDPLITGALPDRPAAAEAPASPPTDRPEPDAPSRGYVLRRVSGGTALVEGPSGLRQVVPGAVLPGAGRVISIRATGSGWVVVTSDTIIGPAPL